MTKLTARDIYFLTDDKIGGKTLEALVLGENGIALDIHQDNSTQEQLHPEQCTFTCTLMRPLDDSDLATLSHPELKGFEYINTKQGMTLNQVVDSLNALNALAPPTQYKPDEILRHAHRSKNRHRNHYTPTQLWKQPVHCGSGAYLNADKLQENIRYGQFRDAHDARSPHLFEPFRANEIKLNTGTDKDGVSTFSYTVMLLESGHAFYVESNKGGNSECGERYSLTMLETGSGLILQQSAALDMADLFDGFEQFPPTIDNLEFHEISMIANALQRKGPIKPRHSLEQIVAINAMNSSDFPVTQFNRVQFDENSGRPKTGIILPEQYSSLKPNHL